MHKLVNWLISIVLLLVLATLLKVAASGIIFADRITDNVVIAIIGAITAATTIIGSVFIAQITASHEGKKQRQIEARNLKREFYNRFLEVFSKNMALNNYSSETAFKVNQEFCIEVNRLPLYASQDVVELVNHVASGNAKPGEADFNKLFSVIREDLCSDEYKEFNNLKTINFQIPNRVKQRN